MTTVITAKTSAEFLGIVPSLAGFTPVRSLVLLPFSGTRTSGAMRIDLPLDGVDLGAYVDSVLGLLTRVDGADAVALVVYCDDAPEHTSDGLVLPHSVLSDVFTACATAAGLRIVDALCVAPGGWASYLDDDPFLLPLSVGAPSVPGIGDVSGDQNSGLELPRADLAEKELVGRALRDLESLVHDGDLIRMTGRQNPQAIAALSMLDDLPTFFESVLESPSTAQPFATAALLWALDRPMLRDVALTQWATGPSTGVRALDAQLTYSSAGAVIPDDIGEIFLGRGRQPSMDRLLLALSVVRIAAARAPRSSRSAPLTAAAWLSWALGRTTHAVHYLDMVRAIDPDYRLAALITTMIDAAVLPEWAFQRNAGKTR